MMLAQFSRSAFQLVCEPPFARRRVVSPTAVHKRTYLPQEMPVCNESNILEYSDLCLSDDPPQDCYPSLDSTNNVIALSLAFQALNIFLGLGTIPI